MSGSFRNDGGHGFATHQSQSGAVALHPFRVHVADAINAGCRTMENFPDEIRFYRRGEVETHLSVAGDAHTQRNLDLRLQFADNPRHRSNCDDLHVIGLGDVTSIERKNWMNSSRSLW